MPRHHPRADSRTDRRIEPDSPSARYIRCRNRFRPSLRRELQLLRSLHRYHSLRVARSCLRSSLRVRFDSASLAPIVRFLETPHVRRTLQRIPVMPPWHRSPKHSLWCLSPAIFGGHMHLAAGDAQARDWRAISFARHPFLLLPLRSHWRSHAVFTHHIKRSDVRAPFLDSQSSETISNRFGDGSDALFHSAPISAAINRPIHTPSSQASRRRVMPESAPAEPSSVPPEAATCCAPASMPCESARRPSRSAARQVRCR
jgi:hypothetical protein